ncbi:hypothetical protein CEH05_11340 [Halobacillus halophilus]|nr:hypothetical protein CEH05_11340 [Halobacillus halophilus]
MLNVFKRMKNDLSPCLISFKELVRNVLQEDGSFNYIMKLLISGIFHLDDVIELDCLGLYDGEILFGRGSFGKGRYL